MQQNILVPRERISKWANLLWRIKNKNNKIQEMWASSGRVWKFFFFCEEQQLVAWWKKSIKNQVWKCTLVYFLIYFFRLSLNFIEIILILCGSAVEMGARLTRRVIFSKFSQDDVIQLDYFELCINLCWIINFSGCFEMRDIWISYYCCLWKQKQLEITILLKRSGQSGIFKKFMVIIIFCLKYTLGS